MYSLRSSTPESIPQAKSESGASGSSRCTATSKSGWSAGIQSVPGGTHWGGGISISARDQWRLARLLMGDRPELLPHGWIAAMRTPCALAPFYGYLIWLNTGRRVMPSASASSFFAVGAGSSVIWHDPERDLVAVIRWVEADGADAVVASINEALAESGTIPGQPGRGGATG